MSNNNNLPTDNQFVVSFELLQLLEWLMEHHPEEIKKIINRSLSQGLAAQIQRADDIIEGYTLQDMQDSILDFFNLLEVLLIESLGERQEDKKLQAELIPTINHIDKTSCDFTTLSTSIEKATTKISKHPHENPQTILFRELLKNWKPAKKAVVH